MIVGIWSSLESISASCSWPVLDLFCQHVHLWKEPIFIFIWSTKAVLQFLYLPLPGYFCHLCTLHCLRERLGVLAEKYVDYLICENNLHLEDNLINLQQRLVLLYLHSMAYKYLYLVNHCCCILTSPGNFVKVFWGTVFETTP